MADYCSHLKSHLEGTFSMPFNVVSFDVEGENGYRCSPQNEDNIYFDVNIRIRNRIRLVIEITPQLHGGYILHDMSLASPEKKSLFFEYQEMLKQLGAKVRFCVNGSAITVDSWPSSWRNFSSKITLIPIPEDVSELEYLKEWVVRSVELIFTLLTISDVENEDPQSIQTEGTPHIIKAIRYERNPINRQLCLFRKGYSCAVCGMNFEDVYGELGHHYIEVHHTTPVSTMKEGYVFNVDRDLVPLCSNCHSMVHRQDPPLSVDQLKEILIKQKSNG